MNPESKFRLVPKDVRVEFGAKLHQTKVFIDGEQVERVAFVGISRSVDDQSPVLILEYWVKGGQGRGKIEIPITGVFAGKGIGG